MSKSMVGYMDRSVPVKLQHVVTVREVIEKTYRDADPAGCYKAMTDQNRGGFENRCFTDAVDRLDPDDARFIESQVKRADPDQKNRRSLGMKNFGRLAMTELLAKMGIFLNANSPKN